jgi:multiple sugar transport system substrate-binding protein
MKMKSSLFILCVVLMLLSACGGTASVEPPPPTDIPTAPVAEQEQARDRVTVRFAAFDWELPRYEDLIEAFEEENPDVKIQVVSANEVLGISLTGDLEYPEDAARRLASAADVVSGSASRQDVEEGLVYDLTPLIESDPNFQADDFYPNTLETQQWDGGTWGLPTSVTFYLIFFNKDAFDEAGVAYPEPGWSWDDLAAKAQTLTARDGDEVARWGFVAPSGSHTLLIESRVGPLVDDTTEPPTPRFEEAEVLDAVRWYADLFLEEQSAPYIEPLDEDADALALPEEYTLIERGQAAMWAEADTTWALRQMQGNVGAVPFPVDTPAARTTPFWTENLSLSAGTAQPQAAWRFMDYLSRQMMGNLGLGTNPLPARRSVVETQGFWNDLDEEQAETLRYALDHSFRQQWTEGYSAFSDAMNAILSGEKSAEDALAEAQAQAEADIQGELAEKAGATPMPTVVVAPPEEETPVSEAAVSIVFMPGLGSLNLEPYRDLAARFQEMHPDIAVEVKMADLISGNVPDVPGMAEAADCFEWYPSLQDAESREAILNLEPFLDADPSFTTDDFLPQVLEQFTYQGQLYGLPADVTPYIIEYNKDLFDAADLAYPALDWTTDDFLSLAVALTEGEDEEKQYGFVAEVYELNDLIFMLERLGARLIDDKVDPPALSLDDPATVEALRWYANLSTEYAVKPVYVTDITKLLGATSSYLEREQLINSGRAAMWTSTGTTAAIFGDRGDMNLGAAPLPTGPGTTGGGYAGASGYFISAETEQRQACWLWLTFLSGQPGAVQGLPARRSVAESDAYRERVGADRADAYLASVASGDQPSDFQILSEEDWLGIAILWLGQAYGQVLDGELDVEDALAAAQKLADDYRACLIAADDFSTDSSRACAQEVDPTLPDFLFGTGE